MFELVFIRHIQLTLRRHVWNILIIPVLIAQRKKRWLIAQLNVHSLRFGSIVNVNDDRHLDRVVVSEFVLPYQTTSVLRLSGRFYAFFR